MRYLLDSTVLIDALRGRPAGVHLRDLRRSGEVPLVCAINVEEVMRGARPDEREATVGFLKAFRIAPLGFSQGLLAGEWRREFASRGVTLSQADCLIAAAAVAVDATLATGNPAHFPMDELQVDHWQVGG